MTNEYDVHVHKSDLSDLTRYVRLSFILFIRLFCIFTLQLTISSGTTVHVDSLGKLSSSLKTPLPSGDPTR